MREGDIHKLIEQQEPEAKQRIWEKIVSQVDLTSAPSVSNKPVYKRKIGLWTAFAVALVCIVTLSVVLPLTINSNEGDRYADFNNYTIEPLGESFKEYFAEHNLDILYLDWYGVAEEVISEYGHINGNKSDVVFFKERIANAETGDVVFLYVTDNKTRVDIFKTHYLAKDNFTVNGVKVSWSIFNGKAIYAMFEYNNYVYYLQIDSLSQELLTDIIKTMLK